jgi:hypothetical protein
VEGRIRLLHAEAKAHAHIIAVDRFGGLSVRGAIEDTRPLLFVGIRGHCSFESRTDVLRSHYTPECVRIVESEESSIFNIYIFVL